MCVCVCMCLHMTRYVLIIIMIINIIYTINKENSISSGNIPSLKNILKCWYFEIVLFFLSTDWLFENWHVHNETDLTFFLINIHFLYVSLFEIDFRWRKRDFSEFSVHVTSYDFSCCVTSTIKKKNIRRNLKDIVQWTNSS